MDADPVRNDDGQARSHRLGDRDAEILRAGGQHEDVRVGKRGVLVVACQKSRPQYVGCDPARRRVGVQPIHERGRAVAGDDQHRIGHLPAHRGKGRQQQVEPFLLIDSREKKDDPASAKLGKARVATGRYTATHSTREAGSE